MLEGEPWTGADRRRSILRRHDNGRLRQPAQGMRPYPGRPSRLSSLPIEVVVMTGGKIMNAALKQRDDPIGGMRGYFYRARNRMAVSSGLSDPFGRLLVLHHGQLHSLPVFKSNFRERFKDSIFVESFDGFCHG